MATIASDSAFEDLLIAQGVHEHQTQHGWPTHSARQRLYDSLHAEFPSIVDELWESCAELRSTGLGPAQSQDDPQVWRSNGVIPSGPRNQREPQKHPMSEAAAAPRRERRRRLSQMPAPTRPKRNDERYEATPQLRDAVHHWCTVHRLGYAWMVVDALRSLLLATTRPQFRLLAFRETVEEAVGNLPWPIIQYVDEWFGTNCSNPNCQQFVESIWQPEGAPPFPGVLCPVCRFDAAPGDQLNQTAAISTRLLAARSQLGLGYPDHTSDVARALRLPANRITVVGHKTYSEDKAGVPKDGPNDAFAYAYTIIGFGSGPYMPRSSLDCQEHEVLSPYPIFYPASTESQEAPNSVSVILGADILHPAAPGAELRYRWNPQSPSSPYTQIQYGFHWLTPRQRALLVSEGSKIFEKTLVDRGGRPSRLERRNEIHAQLLAMADDWNSKRHHAPRNIEEFCRHFSGHSNFDMSTQTLRNYIDTANLGSWTNFLKRYLERPVISRRARTVRR